MQQFILRYKIGTVLKMLITSFACIVKGLLAGFIKCFCLGLPGIPATPGGLSGLRERHYRRIDMLFIHNVSVSVINDQQQIIFQIMKYNCT